ncbi:MAG: radical SAM family heme chaperone HemW [Verrucomicrobia bacterium]|nr:radical SAM family heme chaperone HemW [Verrucomicrobiota bacterium]
MSAVQHVYVHVPFCSGKCVYCSFYSEPYDEVRATLYLNALQHELEATTPEHTIAAKTLYIGGGTPSLLSPDQLDRLFGLLRDQLDLTALKEWTIEGNPGSFTPERIAILRRHGITRISLGAQSMDDGVLAAMGRRHTAIQTQETVSALKNSGFSRIGLDLIACLPGVSNVMWRQTLEQAIALAPSHLSVYSLSAAPGSTLYERRLRGDSHPATSDDEQYALAEATSQLEAAGYQHYEVSNYALPDHHCRHNVAVWQGEDYIGFGPAAASRVQRQRWINTPDLALYCQPLESGSALPRSVDTLTPQTDAVERFMFSFRLCEGINPLTFSAQHGDAASKLLPVWMEKLAAMEQDGLVMQDRDRWRLTPHGLCFADTVAERLLP